MLRNTRMSAVRGRGVRDERRRTGPPRGGRGLWIAASLVAMAIGSGDAFAQGGLEVASRSAHRTAPRFPAAEESRTRQAEHQVAVGDESRGFVQPAQYVPRSRLMQGRMAARGAYPTHGQMMYDDGAPMEGETVYEGEVGGEFVDGEVVYEGAMPGGVMSGGAMTGRSGMFSGAGRGPLGGMFRPGMGRGPFGGDMVGGPGCSSCGGTPPAWGGASSCGCEGGGQEMGCAGGCGDPCGATACGGGGCNGCLVPCMLFAPSANVEIFAGAAAFKGVPNLGSSGSFGFQEGFLFSGPVPCMPGEPLSWEAGANFVQSDFEGAVFTEDSRRQIFGTAGLFRRVDWGMQGGVVIDYLQDDWYMDANLAQLRGEVSWVYPSGHEIGFWGTMGLGEDTSLATTVVFGGFNQVDLETRPIDLYCAFYRQTFCEGGNARLFGGFTGDSNGIVGMDFNVPMTCNWGLQGGFTFLLPQSDDERDNTGTFDIEQVPTEAWNVNVGVVWSFGGKLKDPCNYHRALLPVAHNGNFFRTLNLPD